jgi:hypothetical protein
MMQSRSALGMPCVQQFHGSPQLPTLRSTSHGSPTSGCTSASCALRPPRFVSPVASLAHNRKSIGHVQSFILGSQSMNATSPSLPARLLLKITNSWCYATLIIKWELCI